MNSSEDPARYSLTVKSAGLLMIPTVLNIIGTACSFGIFCADLNSESLSAAVNAASQVVSGLLYIVGGVLFLFGFARKLVNSFYK